jgi:hypothetical protein
METSESTVIYPTEEGWVILKEKIKNIELLSPDIFERHFKHYTNTLDNSYKFVYNVDRVKELFPEFLCKSKYATKKHILVESPMQEYLRVKGITMRQFKAQMASIAYNDYD